ncbi:hypothetical protein IEQ34_021687 [Dendrobium chrysotoxum]|uniref:Uncharacterized protein n=1 Tax=Dendrobium chrysotoxum TaxID=161865 RepID=A0AAV7G5F7_DENCH|nr:hypothetical protein IEQ34_021687 [Dendrobium chrysotoxum]
MPNPMETEYVEAATPVVPQEEKAQDPPEKVDAASTGIAKRVRQRADRKRKLVKSPFTTGKRKSHKDGEMATAKGREHEEIKAGPDVIEVNEKIKMEMRPAPPKVDYPGRSMITEEMSIFIEKYFEKFNDKGNIVFSSGNVVIYRSQIDELITDQYLDNNHVDAFAITLAEKNKISPGIPSDVPIGYRAFFLEDTERCSYRIPSVFPRGYRAVFL